MLDETCGLLVDHGGCECACVYLGEDVDRIELSACCGRRSLWRDVFAKWLNSAGSPVVEALTAGGTVVCEEAGADPGFSALWDIARECGASTLCFIPLSCVSGTVGVLCVGSDGFDDYSIGLLEALAGDLAAAVLRVRDDDTKTKIIKNLQQNTDLIEACDAPVFWVLLDGSIANVNDAAAKHLGYTRNELLSLKIPDFDIKYHTPERLVLRERMRKELGSWTFETEHRCKDGSLIPVQIMLSFSKHVGDDCVLAIATDITEQKLVQAQSRAMLSDIVNSIPQAVFWKDVNSVYLGCNKAFTETTGLEKTEDVVGLTDYELSWSCEETEHFRSDDREVMESNLPKAHIIERARRADGVEIWVDTTKVPLHDHEGRVIGVIGAYEDITERLRADEALRESNESLKQLSKQLIELQESERRYLARELHDEIGSMLTALSVAVSIASNAPPEKVSHSLEQAKSLASELADKVSDMSLNLRPSMLDDMGLKPALRWYLTRFAEQTGIEVDFKSSGIGRRFSSRLETTAYRIIQEATTNTARHSNSRKVSITLIVDDGKLKLQIKDYGRGFNAKDVLAKPYTGGVLGMHERVKLIGGKLTISSGEKEGALISAEMPVD